MPKTVIVTFKAPEELVNSLDQLVRRGVFRSRSEALRHALALLINKYGGMGYGRQSRAEPGGDRGPLQAKVAGAYAEQ